MRSILANTKNTVTRFVVIGALLLAGAVLLFRSPAEGVAEDVGDDPSWQTGLASAAVVQDYLLNGGLNGNYYWVYPNHYVAPEWRRWWMTGSVLPEYDRTRNTEPFIEGDRSQRVHKWGDRYVAGIYQVADVTPCVNYRLSVWTRFDSVPGARSYGRVGLDPTGTQLTGSPNSGEITAFPPLMVWSSEQTQQFAWVEQTATAEAVGNKITAMTYGAPEPDPGSSQTPYFTFYWDKASLTQVPFPGGRLPDPSSWTPSGFIENLTTSFADGRLTIEWDTPTLASSQIIYSVTPATVTITVPLTHTVYLPMIAAGPHYPPLDTTPVLHHTMGISGLDDGDVVDFVALSRWSNGTACNTETSEPVQITIGSGAMVSLDPSAVPDLISPSSARR